MAWTPVMDLSFDSLAKAGDFWSIYDSSAGGQLCPPKFVSDGANSHIEIFIAETPVAVSYAFESKDGPIVGRGMDVSLGYAADTLVNCFDLDPAKRGRYIKVGASGTGSWSLVSSTIEDKLWADQNHPQRLLELILCTWLDTTPPAPGAGPEAGYTTPPGNDWRRARVTFDMQAIDLYLGHWAKIAQHVQGIVPAMTANLPKRMAFTAQPANDSTITVNGTVFTFKASGATGNQINKGVDLATTIANAVTVLNASVAGDVDHAEYSGSATTLVATPNEDDGTAFTLVAGAGTNAAVLDDNAYPNFIFTKQLISDQLGFGVDSWGVPNLRKFVPNTGRIDVVLEYTDNDYDWACLGGITRPPSFATYLVSSISTILSNLIGNSYMMAVHPYPMTGDDYFTPVPVSRLTEADRIRGTLRFFGIKIEVETD